MRNYYLVILFILVGQAAVAQTGSALVDSANAFHLFQTSDVKIDLKFMDPNQGSFGIDYQVNLKRSFKTFAKEDTIIKPNINLNLSSKGFVTVRGGANQVNSIINELNVELSPIIRQKRITQTLDPLVELEKTDDQIMQLTREQASKVSSPFWLLFNLHAKHETTQNFGSYDLAFGGTATFTTSFLNAILDYPFGLLRVGKNNNPRQIDFSVVYDYVTGLNNTSLKYLRNDNSTNRASMNIEWETGILKNERISFLYNRYYELNAPLTIRQVGLDKTYYYQVKLEHPLSIGSDKTRKTVSIKYSQGELPPDFTKGYVLGGGFTLQF